MDYLKQAEELLERLGEMSIQTLNESEDIKPNIQKIIKTFRLTRRKSDKRLFFENMSGAANYNDINHLQKQIPDLKIEGKSSGLAWVAFSDKELIEIDYTEGDIYLIIYNNKNELEKAKKKAIKFAKENY